MNIRLEIQSVIEAALRAMDIAVPENIVIDYPERLEMGDFATPIAMQLAKQMDRNPRELADNIAKQINLETRSPSWLEKVEIAGPGFINFTLSKYFWQNHTQNVLARGAQWGWGNVLEGEHWLIEHSSPNMFKPFHIGHLVNNFVGASLVRIIAAQGADVTQVSFPSDVSPGIAKAVWGLMNMGITDNFSIQDIGDAYAHGSTQYKESELAKTEIDRINLEIYQKQNTAAYEVYRQGLALSEQYFLDITARLGSTFAGLLPESVCEIEGKEIVRTHTPAVFEESEGAVIFRGSRYGLFDNVFINSAGFGTYLTKDIGLMSLKLKQYDFDRSITVTDIEQKQHFQLLKKSAEQIDTLQAEKSEYIQHGRLALTSGKISSRDGGVPLAEELLDAVTVKVQQKASEKTGELDSEDAERVAQAALKFAILKTSAGKNIIFDFETDLSFEGNSGPYLQYTCVRSRSVIKQINHSGPTAVKLETARCEIIPNLERMLVRFPDYVMKALNDFSPHHVAGYLQQLAAEFNSFYANTKINDPENPDMQHNVLLVEAFAQTMKNGLWLLGIETVERM